MKEAKLHQLDLCLGTWEHAASAIEAPKKTLVINDDGGPQPLRTLHLTHMRSLSSAPHVYLNFGSGLLAGRSLCTANPHVGQTLSEPHLRQV